MIDSSFQVRDTRKRGFFLIDNAFMDTCAAALGPQATLVYFCICRHSDRDQIAYPSQEKIAKSCGISQRSVKNAIRILRDSMMIRILREGKGKAGQWGHNIYELQDREKWVLPGARPAPGPRLEPGAPDAPGTRGTGEQPPGANGDIHQGHQVPLNNITTEKGKQKKKGSGHAPAEDPKPYAFKTDFNSQVIYEYKAARGVPRDDRTWDKLHWPRAMAIAKVLNDALDGDIALGVLCIQQVSADLKRDFTPAQWNLDTIVHKRAAEWLLRHRQRLQAKRSETSHEQAAREAERRQEEERAREERAHAAALTAIAALPAAEQEEIRAMAQKRLGKKAAWLPSGGPNLILQLEMVEIWKGRQAAKEGHHGLLRQA